MLAAMPSQPPDPPEGAPRGSPESNEPEWRPHAQPSVRVLRPGETSSAEPGRPPAAESSVEAEAQPPIIEDVAPSRLPRVLGVNFAGGAAYLAVIERPNRPRLDLADVITPAAGLASGERLRGFSDQVARTLRELRVASVAIARPLRPSNWRYADAFERASLETCIVLEAHRASVPLDWVGQSHAANVIGLPLDRLDEALPAKLRIERTARWADRYPAVLVALAVALAGSGATTDSRPA
jgi:hypothetical protein